MADVASKKSKSKLFAQTRKLSVKEGAAASVMVGCVENNITPYALELKATNLEAGLLASFANLLGPLAQLIGSRLLEKWHRKKIVLWGVGAQVLACFLLASIGWIFLASGKNLYLVPLFIGAYVLYNLTGSLAGPAWFSLMGDAVPENIRGRYFSFRNKVAGIFSVSATILGALLLYYLQQFEIIYGFIIIFGVAGLSRFISALMFRRHYIEDLTLEKNYYFSFWQFLRKIRYFNFNRFSLYVALIMFGTNIAGPFYAVYMWKILKLNPLWFAAVNVSVSIFMLLFFPVWGRFSEKYGNRETVKVGSLILLLVPLLWSVSANPLFLIFVTQLVAGLGWSAFNLSSSNFIYDSVEPTRRALMVAYYNLLSGIGIFAGAVLGGVITQFLNFGGSGVFIMLFLLSGLVRLIVMVAVLPKIKEVRSYEHAAQKNPLSYLKEIAPLHETFHATTYPLRQANVLRKKLGLYRRERIRYF
ncbi:MAG: MFS transporter [Candidatus Buchananbacteria bacterium]|nr:MFS transporter [Candidatus Buchananbacteria bacterium]